MAKDKQTDEITPAGPEAPAQPPVDEAAQAEISRLKAQLAEKEAALKAALAAPKAEPPRRSKTGRWHCKLPDCPGRVVEAPDAANAFEAYKALVGVIHSPHAPTINPTDLPIGPVPRG